MNLLEKTKVYLIGAMQYKNGQMWRSLLTKQLEELGIVCFDPYKKPFTVDVEESEKVAEELKDLIEQKNYDEVARRMRPVRIFDLSMVDRADFIIAYIDPSVHTAGTYEEFFWANRQKKPIFLIVEGGKSKCPWWLFGTIPHKYIYNNVDEAFEVIRQINSGEKPIDNDRWKLLRLEYR
jgi:nucleoside 2-deoxyribosyltransferase